MRKPTRKVRHWQRIHTANLEGRRSKGGRGKGGPSRGRRSRKGRDRHKRRKHRSLPPPRRKQVNLTCPRVLSLHCGFDGVVNLINEMRRHSSVNPNVNAYIDFKKIKELDPAAALVLAAEIDRWNDMLVAKTARFRTVDIKKWDVRVRSLLGQMGFFDLLGATGAERDDPASTTKYVKFKSGTKVSGKAINEIRELELDPYTPPPERHLLYGAVTEAMTNVVQHAYRGDSGRQTAWHQAHGRTKSNRRPKKWWLSAAFDTAKREVVVIIYDQGRGIRDTLSRRFGERLKEIMPDWRKQSHAEVIRLAHELHRSASDDEHRGYGLNRDIRRYVEGRPDSAYHVFSGRGLYSVRTDGDDSLRTFDTTLKGTLIEWRIKCDE